MKNVFLCLFFVFCLFIVSCNKKDCGEGVYEKGECLCNAGWKKDANGRCTEQDLCYNKDCGEHGNCNSQGNCECDPGWAIGGSGKCDTQDFCYNKDCGHGTCSSPSGVCNCDPYYEKDANGICTIEVRSRFVGTWRGDHVNTVSGNSSGIYDFTITAPDFDVTKIKISNLFNYSCNSGRLEIYTTIGSSGNTAAGASSLCSQYPVSNNFSIQFIDPNTIKLRGFVEDGGTGLGWNLEGIYSRQ